MQIGSVVNAVTYAEPIVCLITLAAIAYRRQLRAFSYLSLFLFIRTLSLAVLLPVYALTAGHRLERHLGYKLYFYIYWSSFTVETLLTFFIIYNLYKLAMAPLPGLQRLGIVMFRWAAGIGTTLALSLAANPSAGSSLTYLPRFLTQLQQTISILTLCMLLFVCLASKPMGLSQKSKIFGVSLGLGLLAATDMVFSAWFTTETTLYSMSQLIHGLAICLSIGIWFVYFVIPEPKRRMIVLPTTSPFLRWNQISMVLGDEPGFVAVGEVTVEMFAPAEVEIMRRASAKMSRSFLPQAAAS